MGFPTFLYRNRRIWWFTIGLPTLSGVLPTNKNIPPPIRKPQPIYSDLFLLLAAFALAFFLQGLDQDCIASGFLIHLWQMLLVQKRHPKNDWFLIKKSLNRILLGARKGYPPWVVSSPQIKARTPTVRKPQPIHSDLFLLLAAFALVFFARIRSRLHCLRFPHPPLTDAFGPEKAS